MEDVSRLAQRGPFGRFSDAGHRLSDMVNNVVASHKPLELHGKWLAARLSDGQIDPAIYDSHKDAVSHQSDENLWLFMKIPVDGLSPQEAESYLQFNRQIRANGYRMPSPESHTEMPSTFRPKLWLPTNRRNGI